MHRLLVPSAELSSDSPVLSKDAANHLKVLRPKDGEEFELFDGKGSWRVYAYRSATKNFAAVDPDLSRQPPPQPLTLFACVTKGSRWDWTIEKATELGVTRIVPVLSERTIVRVDPAERAAKGERWTRIAEEAARQSDAKWIPEIHEPVSFAESLALVKETSCFVGALTTPPPKTIGEVLRSSISHYNSPSSLPLSLYVGPEGDFSPTELASLLAVAVPVSFGTTILRAETAAIYGVSAIKTFLDASVNLKAQP